MNLLFYNTLKVSPDVGGVERVITSMYQWLTNKGHKITILYVKETTSEKSLPNQIKLPAQYANDKINEDFIIHNILNNNYNIAINFVALFTRHIAAYENAIIKTGLPSISVYHNTLDAPLQSRSFFQKLLHHKISSIILYSLFGLYQKIPFIRNAKYYSTHSAADVILAECYKPMFRKLINGTPNRLEAIYNPLPVEYESVNEITSKEKKILFIGRLEKQKNLSALLRIWSIVSPPKGWILEIVGDGSCKEDLIAEAKSMHILDSVNFKGATDTPQKFYEKSVALVMTSTFEGFPMTLLECQMFGCIPIIYNSYPAAKEIIADRVNGFLIPNGDEENFAKIIKQIMSAENTELENMRFQCKKYASRYNLDNIMNKWIKLIKELAKT